MRGPVDRIAAFVEDLVQNRRPCRFKASPEDLHVLHFAAALAGARPGADLPDRRFIEHVCASITVSVAGRLRLRGDVRERLFP